MIRVSGVSAGYDDRPVLRDVTFDLEPRSLTGLVGPNGSGKTTLIRVLSGLLKPTTGTVIVGEAAVERSNAARLARLVAVVPQTPVLPEGFTVAEIVLMGRTPHLGLWEMESSRDLQLARQAMTEVGIRDLAERPVQELSGGEAQRVVIARALAQEAPAMLLDEPTAHLDLSHQAMTFALARRLAEGKGKTILAVAHDITLASAYCDRMLVLHKGRLVAQGDPKEVITNELIAGVYGAGARVIRDPDSGRPVVLPALS